MGHDRNHEASYKAALPLFADPARRNEGLARLQECAAQGFGPAAYHLAWWALHSDAEDSRSAALGWLNTAIAAGYPHALYAAGLLWARFGHREHTLNALARAALAGDTLAFYPLGYRLLDPAGDHYCRAAGAFWLALAAKEQYYAALALLATDPNLLRSADPLTAETVTRALAANDYNIALSSWPEKSAADPVTHYAEPPVVTIDEYINADECAHLMHIAQPLLKRSRVVDPNSGSPLVLAIRASDDAVISAERRDLHFLLIEQHLAATAGQPPANAEPFTIIRYPPGGEYRPHHDYFPPGSGDEEAQSGRGGQRIFTAFIYLCDVAGGGETQFPELGIKIGPRRGRLLMFSNVDAEGRPAACTLHASLPVVRGEKWIATKWFRQGAILKDSPADGI